MNILTVRPALPKDAERICEIYAPYVIKTAITFEYEVPTKEKMAERIQDTIQQNYPYLVACDNQGGIVGYAYAGKFANRPAYQFTSELSIYVDSHMQLKGVGQLLYDAIEEQLIQQSIVNLISIIKVPNEASIKFHEKNGFKEIGYFKNAGYKFEEWHDIIWMQKELNKPF